MQGYLAGKMGLLKLLEQKAEATEDRFDIGRYFELESTLFELKNLISELKRFGDQEHQETQEQADQPTEQLEGDEHLTLLEFCKKHGVALYRNKKPFTDEADDTFNAGSMIIGDKGKWNVCLSNGISAIHSSFKSELEKGNMIELHNPNA